MYSLKKFMHRQLTNMDVSMTKLNFSLLTEKESIILTLWLCGQTAKQSGSYLDKSARTIEYHRERIKCKLGVYCKSELYIKAIKSPEFMVLLERGKKFIQSKICIAEAL